MDAFFQIQLLDVYYPYNSPGETVNFLSKDQTFQLISEKIIRNDKNGVWAIGGETAEHMPSALSVSSHTQDEEVLSFAGHYWQSRVQRIYASISVRVVLCISCFASSCVLNWKVGNVLEPLVGLKACQSHRIGFFI